MKDDRGPQAIHVGDWKTGWGTDEHPRQLQGYALGLVEEFGWPRKDVVSVWEIWTTHQQQRVTNLSREDLEGFRVELARIIEAARQRPEVRPPDGASVDTIREIREAIIKFDKSEPPRDALVLPAGCEVKWTTVNTLEYRAGSHCRWCPHRADCTVRDAWMRSAVTAMVAIDHGRAITRETLGRAYLKFQEVQKACGQFERVVKSALEDGPIPLPDGRQVAMVESEREKIDATAALKALDDRVDDAGRALLLGDISKKALDNWAKGNSVKGKKAALLREVNKELKAAGAIRSVTHRQRGIVDG
jgi:hypothetical protein